MKFAATGWIAGMTARIVMFGKRNMGKKMMSQLYKMTLYVCDLDESLSLDKIKILIKQDALDGVAVNCLCHFADEQIGPQVEWADDIDLNEWNCPTSVWDKYFE